MLSLWDPPREYSEMLAVRRQLHFEKATELARSIEATEMQTSLLKGTNNTTVMKIIQRSQSSRAPAIPDQQEKCNRCGEAKPKIVAIRIPNVLLS